MSYLRYSLRGRGLTTGQICSWYILQPQPTGPQDTRCEEGVLPQGRDAVGVFYSPNQLGHRTLVIAKGSYTWAEMQSVYSTAPTDWATGHSLWGRGLTTWQRCSRCILHPQLTRLQDTVCEEEVLPLGRDAVGVFYSPNWQGYRTLVLRKGSYNLVVYSSTLND